MRYGFEQIIQQGRVIDPVNRINEIRDIGIAGGKIAAVEPHLSPHCSKDVVDLQGCWVFPGIVDLHVHASSWLGGRHAHKMMARAGVTTALDMSGPLDSVLSFARDHGVGLNLACIQSVRPGHSVRDADPGRAELEALLGSTLRKGGIGFKILGGHYPLTPEATSLAIEVANKNNAYVAFHAGSTKSGSDLNGFKEAVDLAGNHCVHLAHINSYCRGKTKPCALEAEEAISMLEDHPEICSESYLSPLNGTSAKCAGGVPESKVTSDCLLSGGFAATEQGMEEAIRHGWARINRESGGEVILSTGDEAVKWWRDKKTDTTVSFPVNPVEPRIRLASAKRKNGLFAVDALSTDGGGIPRNVTIELGLSLIRLQALSAMEFVLKTSTNPARLLGLYNKGHLGVGADADITGVDPVGQKAVMTMVQGKIIMWRERVFGKGCRFITTASGLNHVRKKGLDAMVIDPVETPFFHRNWTG